MNHQLADELDNPVSTTTIGPLTVMCLRSGMATVEWYSQCGNGQRLIIYPDELAPLVSLLTDHLLASRAGRAITREELCRGH
ncbi:hypothetical protein [Arenimonas sp.]|uniref:hypothetical protein n=1 Tax=Arenimonas sp. TaxID=1872635 RepID=UPI0035AFDD90